MTYHVHQHHYQVRGPALPHRLQAYTDAGTIAAVRYRAAGVFGTPAELCWFPQGYVRYN